MFAHGRFQTLLKRLARSRRRGTILLLVLGALAMVLILTVVYAALGKSDRTTGRAVNQQRAATEVIKRVGEHVAGIIGDDVNDLVPDFAERRLLELRHPDEPIDDLPRFARYRPEGFDAPVSDFSKRSVPSLDTTLSGISSEEESLLQFRPTGGHSTIIMWPENDGNINGLGGQYPRDPRIAADPWLASTRPTDFGVGSKDPGLVGGGTYADIPFYARALDWLQISNVAPDGRFVNLFYLREDANQPDETGFAVPSLDLTRDPDTDEPRLTLFDIDGAAVAAGNGNFVLGLAGVEDYAGIYIENGTTNPGGIATPDWNVPAHWTMYQRNMARTIAELSREGFETNDPNDPRYWEYSYADADGDGIIDSRWFELVDASSGLEVPLLGDTDRRYFAAVRVIDLSSLANVNTATDTIEPPTLESRAGQGPQDVSLFTLLTLDMHRQAVTGVGADVASYGGQDNEASYASFFAPINGEDDRNDYEQMDVNEQITFGRKAYLRLRESILDWQPVEFGAVPTQANDNAAWSTALEDYTPYAFSAEGPDRKREDFALFGSAVPGFAGGGSARTGPFGVSDLIELLTFHGANDPEVFSALEQAFTIGQGDRDDPLHTRSLLRSDRTLAAEIGVQGVGTGDSLTQEELNRRARAQLDIRSLLTTISGSRPIRSVTTDAGGILALGDEQRRFRVDELMLGSPTYEGIGETDADDIREQQNQARNPLIQNGYEVYLRTLAPHLDEFAGGTAWPNAGADVDDHARTLFYGHTGPEMALRMAAHMAVNFRDAADAPFVDVQSGTEGVPDPGTLLGVEANGTAVEITVDEDGDGVVDSNVPYAERRDEPSRALLWLVSEAQREATNAVDTLLNLMLGGASGTIGSEAEQLANEIAVLDADEILGTTDSSVLVSEAATQDRSADAMIVYGVEAQPFLSEVFYFNAYWDAPRADADFVDQVSPWGPGNGTGEDSDLLAENPENGEYSVQDGADPFSDFGSPAGPNLVRGTVTIDGEVDSGINLADTGNRDFLFQVLAFQVFNPFDVPVTLDDFYIEFGGWLYRPRSFGAGGGQSVVLSPNETRLLFATNPGVDFGNRRIAYQPIVDRIKVITDAADDLNNPFADPFQQTPLSGVLSRDLGRNIIDNILPDDDRIPLERFNLDGSALVPGDPSDLLAINDPDDYGTDDQRNRVALLWWDLGERQASTTDISWRRDDLLADRLTDPTPVGQAPTLDQRLNLETVPFADNGTVNPPFEVNNAVTGANFAIDSTGPTAFSESFEFLLSTTGQVPMNTTGGSTQERSIGLWGRIRRFDLTSDDEGAGGRRANDLPGPDGVIPLDPTTLPTGINPGQGDNAVLGVPDGSLPAAALATDDTDAADTIQDNESVNARPFSRTELWYDRSFEQFPVGAGIPSRNFESATTLADFLVEQLGATDVSTRFRDNRQASLAAGIMDPLRYGTTPDAYDGYADIATQTSRTEPYAGSNLIQLSHNSREFRTTIDGFPQLRVGDLLNVLAVGPYRMPLRTTGVGPDGYPTDPDLRVAAYADQWTTLSEALGVAEGVLTNLEDPAGPNTDVFDQLAGVLDRGHLRLDDFVPYFDFDADPATPFDPADDRVRGLGIPLALNIFDIAQAGGELPDRSNGGIDRPVAGLININTAPPSVLRLLPGLYQDLAVNGGLGPQSPSWTNRLRLEAANASLEVQFDNGLIPGSSFVDVGAPSGTGGDRRIDVASSLLSYREPTAGYHRSLWTDGPLLGPPFADVPLNMGPFATIDNAGNPDLTRGIQILRDAVDSNSDGVPDLSEGPNIVGLRTELGFGSIGELLAVRSSGDSTNRFEGERFQYGMDWIARDRRTVSQLFIDPANGDPATNEPDYTIPQDVHDFIFTDGTRIVSLDPSLLGDPLRFSDGADAEFQLPVADQIPDDYDEQLIQMNLLANSVSTSSDFYAAWMVIHGFEDDDVEDLDDNEPMRPSFRTRYLMIVDRSNVVARGDTPRVLAFLEVPYDQQVREAVYTPE